MERKEVLRLQGVRPSGRQLRQQEMEFYGFIHFSINTFTGREWGDGTEDPALFAPQDLDCGQWARAMKAAGMKGIILTCKHHDGFCLWPTRTTKHSVTSSPFRDGKGDVVREMAQACRGEGLAFGIYLSPWDRNAPCYGEGKAYDDFFIAQLTELLTGYGEIFCVWLDGACGEGKNGRRQVYDWERYYETVRRLQPGACISVCGPDIRWCGNEAGQARPEEWSVVPARLKDAEKVMDDSQKEDSPAFRERPIRSSDQDLGSRARLAGEKKLIWYPAEVDVSIRPGWFYHPEEDGRVKSLKQLIYIYETSVGGNAMLLLNVPPGPSGKISPADECRLKELGDWIRDKFSWEKELAPLAEKSVQTRVWEDGEEGCCAIRLRWEKPVKIARIVLQEDLRFGQRVERFALLDENGVRLYEGRTVGHKKIAVLLEKKTVREVTVEIEESRGAPVLRFLGVYG